MNKIIFRSPALITRWVYLLVVPSSRFSDRKYIANWFALRWEIYPFYIVPKLSV